MEKERLEKLAKLVRYYILRMTTKAGSGHATSALSATDMMVALFFNHLRFDLKEPENPNNDRVIFSKGHASPLLYALWAAAGVLSEKEIDSYREFGSVLEGHPTPRFPLVDVATGSLGQGLSIGLGMALAMRREIRNPKSEIRNLPKVYVLMGDSETSEGSVWEAVQLASYYKEVSLRSTSLRSSSLDKPLGHELGAEWLGTAGLKLGNLVGIVDVNRLGQRGETMLGWKVKEYKARFEAFGWGTHVCDGHNFDEILAVFDEVSKKTDRPQMVIAKTIKGKGVGFLEDREGWHGKALSQEEFEKAVAELGEVDRMVRGEIARPVSSITYEVLRKNTKYKILNTKYQLGEMVATRKAFGEALAKLGEVDQRIVCLDGEVSNSTFAEIFAKKFPKRYFEMFIAEQNMVGTALGMAKRGYVPFVSTFAAFFTRAFDQIRMAAYSQKSSAYSGANIKFVGSHSGVSIGEDGPSQMGLEDIALFRSVFGSVVLAPSDATSCAKLVEAAAFDEGLVYIRCARPPTPVIYKGSEEFKIGGSKVARSSNNDRLTIVACGVCVVEAIKATDELAAEGINVRVIDAYSIKPIDEATLKKAAAETNNLVVSVEDHYFEGGLGDAVLNVFAKDRVAVHKLAVSKMPMSGKPGELLDYEEISAAKIGQRVKGLVD